MVRLRIGAALTLVALLAGPTLHAQQGTSEISGKVTDEQGGILPGASVLITNEATGVFQGKILVKPGAQKTDGYQISQSLLLDDDSQFLAKPELEIYADDVKCSHGSTTGAIDETALFYLRSRGVPREDATALLVLSFLADAIDEVEDEGIQSEIVARLEAWLARRRRA